MRHLFTFVLFFAVACGGTAEDGSRGDVSTKPEPCYSFVPEGVNSQTLKGSWCAFQESEAPGLCDSLKGCLEAGDVCMFDSAAVTQDESSDCNPNKD